MGRIESRSYSDQAQPDNARDERRVVGGHSEILTVKVVNPAGWDVLCVRASQQLRWVLIFDTHGNRMRWNRRRAPQTA